MIVAFDPGLKNLAVWAGVDPDHTEKLGKFELKKKQVCEAVVDLFDTYGWMCDASKIKEAVVETQAPRNIPARIVATSIYAYLRGKGVNVRFSGSRLKDKAMSVYSEKYGVKLKEKPTSLSQRYRVNKQNSVSVATALLGSRILNVFKERGCKLDDVCDAALLGAGVFIENTQNKLSTKTTKNTPIDGSLPR
jgi:hypothetical protein